MKTKKTILLTSILTLMAVSQWASAEWRLDNENSKLNFISTKNNAIAEVHTFEQLSGSINPEGGVNISIDLTSVNTKIDIRDQRMQVHLFETNKFSAAKITASIDVTALKELSPGEQKEYALEMTLDLHGMQKKVDAIFLVTALKEGSVQVSTLQPIILNTADFGLIAGLQKLQALAKLSTIDTAVPITANLIFLQGNTHK